MDLKARWEDFDRDRAETIFMWSVTVTIILSFAILFIYPYTRLILPETRIDLNGEWKISLDDHADYSDPDYNDSAWAAHTFPGSFIVHALKEKNAYEGICWIRKSVNLGPEFQNSNLGLSLGRIANAEEVFVNGVRIGGMGGFPPDDFSMWNHPRNYQIPLGVVRPGGKNVIAVRITYFGMGDVMGNLFISTMDGWGRYTASTAYALVTMGYVCIFMGAAFLVIFLLMYVKRIESQEYLFYCLQLCCGLPVVLDTCIYWNVYPGNLARFTLLGFAWVALNVTHPIFLHRFYNFDRPWMDRFLYVYLGVVVFLGVFITDKSLVRAHGLMLIVSAICVGFYNFSCHISAHLQKSPYHKTFSFFGATVVLCAIHDGFVYMSKFSGYQLNILGYEPTVMIFPIGAIIMYTGTALVLVTRFIDINDEVESLNESLENFIIENAMLTEKLEKTLSKRSAAPISNVAEEKLKSVIKYINENYLNEISREELANSVDVHPDSLGKQFKKYTGQKLGDYIYELRINEAARRLREEDTNIIDIAFDVGFESVRTFNRIFPKFMHTTPNNYRKIHQADQDDKDHSRE